MKKTGLSRLERRYYQANDIFIGRTTARGWITAPMFVLINNGRIFGDELAKLISLNVINIKKFDSDWLTIIFL